ncbi:MAG: hypothetical protein ACOZE5_04475 [Verrucomicrobiota bacterium]
MKNRSVTLSVLTATLFAIPVLAQSEPPAAPAPETGPMKGPHPRREEFIRRFDRNADGKLDETERQAAREEVRAKAREKLVRRFDHDGDGRLNDAEKAEARQARKQFRHEREHRLLRGYMARRHHLRGVDGPGGFGFAGPQGFRGPGGRMRGEILQRFDKDQDGRLDDTERAAAKKAGEEMRARFRENRRDVLARFDQDGDGKLGETERQELRDAWQRFLQQQPPLPAKPAGK